MCKAINDMLYESRLRTLIELTKEDLLSIEKAADKANMTPDQFKETIAKTSLSDTP